MDTGEAIELAPRVWWVGSIFPKNELKCHVYLVEQGDQSVLIDPGSALVTDEVIRKIESVVGLRNVRWLVCSHADPDVIGAVGAMVAHGLHPQATIVTHRRDESLIIHSGTALPYWRIEDNHWRLELEDRTLRFVFTPYLHFAGAFVTFDETSGTLFSSSLFSGFARDQPLVATSETCFDAIRSLHELYMPSREILAHAIHQLRQLPLQQIAPQHGQIIPQRLIVPIMDQLETLECGVYLLSRDDPGLAFLLEANRTIHDVVDTLVREQRFSAVGSYLDDLARRTLESNYLEMWARADGTLWHFDQSDDFEGHPGEAPSDVRSVLDGQKLPPGLRMIWPLTSPSSGQIEGAAVLGFRKTPEFDEPTLAVLAQITSLVEVGLEREVLRRSADLDRAAWHERAIRDALTGLYNRVSLGESFARVLAGDDRNETPQMAILMIDIDHFKNVNDTFSHVMGDRVIQHAAQAIAESIRPNDLVFRFGGEEFLVLLSHINDETALTVAERLRARMAEPVTERPTVTASVGIALRRRGEEQESLIARADQALYRAKTGGRDRVVSDL